MLKCSRPREARGDEAGGKLGGIKGDDRQALIGNARGGEEDEEEDDDEEEHERDRNPEEMPLTQQFSQETGEEDEASAEDEASSWDEKLVAEREEEKRALDAGICDDVVPSSLPHQGSEKAEKSNGFGADEAEKVKEGHLWTAARVERETLNNDNALPERARQDIESASVSWGGDHETPMHFQGPAGMASVGKGVRVGKAALGQDPVQAKEKQAQSDGGVKV